MNSVHPPRNSVHPPRNSVNPPRNSVHAPRNSVNPPLNSVHPPLNSVHLPLNSVYPPHTNSINDCNTFLDEDAMNRVSTNGLFVAFFFSTGIALLVHLLHAPMPNAQCPIPKI
ncbi:hypothetical protein [Nostoc sp. LEGE 12450]|uniref:hypothetical protein n=1 Tax=Nostoc sp. LEGE 12450 TaxID=1828643 RepID=UPI00187E3B18|nr:hypothetical protein [Nostoc sp. LEGE 12450]MBE8989272.1 hypothetical protein [Nostoc sp. LEGE 12450]